MRYKEGIKVKDVKIGEEMDEKRGDVYMPEEVEVESKEYDRFAERLKTKIKCHTIKIRELESLGTQLYNMDPEQCDKLIKTLNILI